MDKHASHDDQQKQHVKADSAKEVSGRLRLKQHKGQGNLHETMINKYLWVLAAMAVPVAVWAQMEVPPVAGTTFILTSTRFFVGLISGLILALAFQMILTNLSVAAGLNMMSEATQPGRRNETGAKEAKEGGLHGTVRTISSAFGLWAMITASIALFFASWLGVSLSMTGSAAAGAIMGLVIWGLFYITMMTIEASAVSSLIGSLAGMVKNGLSSAYGAATSIFKSSPAGESAKGAAEITSAVREELFGSKRDFRNELRGLIDKIKPSADEPLRMAEGIAKLLDDTEITFATSPEGRETVMTFLQKGGVLNKDRAQAVAGGLQNAIAKAKEESSSGKDTVSKIADTAVRVATGASSGESASYRQKVENYLRSTGKQQLNPEGIKRDIEELISSPKTGKEALRSRLASIDRSTVTTLIAQRKDISRDEAGKIVDNIDKVIQEIRGKAQAGTQAAQSSRNSLENKLRNYFDSLHRPELSYEGIAHDMRLLFSDPKEGADAMLDRLKSIDRDTIKALLASRDDISEQDAEHIIQRVESTRDDLVDRATRMKEEVERRLEQAKDEAIRQADETRKTAAVAAWWVFGTAFVSAIFALLGGIAGAA